jgi:hypothetical protein
MLFDPEFREDVYADPSGRLAGQGLTEAEKGFVVRPDRRAYGTDTHRASRALSALIEEYPVTSAIVARENGGIARLHAFFASSDFHECIISRGSIAEAFGAYLATVETDSTFSTLLELELSVVKVRRTCGQVDDEERGSQTGHLMLSPRLRLLRAAPALLREYGRVLSLLDRHEGGRLAGVLAPELSLSGPKSEQGGSTEWILVLCPLGEDAPTMEVLPPALGALLDSARIVASVEQLSGEMVRLGAEPGEAADILAGLINDQLLLWCSAGNLKTGG